MFHHFCHCQRQDHKRQIGVSVFQIRIKSKDLGTGMCIRREINQISGKDRQSMKTKTSAST